MRFIQLRNIFCVRILYLLRPHDNAGTHSEFVVLS